MLGSLYETYFQSLFSYKRSCRRQLWSSLLGLLNVGLFALLIHEFRTFDLQRVLAVLLVAFHLASIRRSWDVGRPWYFCCIPGYCFALLFLRGEEGTNDWGMDPTFEYVPEDFETLDDYYYWVNKKPRFKHSIAYCLVREIFIVAVLLAAIFGVRYAKGFINYESSVKYYDFECSTNLRVYLPEDVSIDQLSIHDIMILKDDDGEAFVFEDPDGEKYCGVCLDWRLRGFDEEKLRSILGSAEPVANVRYSKFTGLRKYLEYLDYFKGKL